MGRDNTEACGHLKRRQQAFFLYSQMASPKNWQSYLSSAYPARLEISPDQELTVELVSRQYHLLFQWWNRKKHESGKYQRAGSEALQRIREAYLALNTEEKIRKYQTKQAAGNPEKQNTAKNSIFRSAYLKVATYLGKYFPLASSPKLLAERHPKE
jgi:hypothetical protein